MSKKSPPFAKEEFALRWRVVTALANTLSRGLVWGLILYLVSSIAPRLCAFVIQSGKPLSPLTKLSQVLTDWLRANYFAVLTLLVLLLVGDLVARLLPPRGGIVRFFFMIWHFGSLWIPILLTILYLLGLVWPLIR